MRDLLRLTILALMAIIALDNTLCHAFDVEVEVEAEDDPDDEVAQGGGGGAASSSSGSSTPLYDGWDSDKLAKLGITKLSNEEYDEKVFGSSELPKGKVGYLIVFVANVGRDAAYNTSRAEMNRLVAQLLTDLSKTKEGKTLNIVFVDTFNDGELLKETFDIERVPSIRLVRGGKTYHLKWNTNGFWSVTDLTNFIKTGYETAPVENLQARVNDGLELYMEYIVNTLAQKNFGPAMENYMTLRKIVYEATGYRHDLKSINPNFGKKNAFKKSQMWTLLTRVIAPLVLLGTALAVTLLWLIVSCLCKLLFKKNGSVSEADQKKADKKKQ